LNPIGPQGIRGEEDPVVLDMPVHPQALEMVVSYLTFHDGVVPPLLRAPLPSSDLRDATPTPSEWDLSLVDMAAADPPLFGQLVYYARDLEIRGLSDLLMAKAATLIRGKDLPSVRKWVDTLRWTPIPSNTTSTSAQSSGSSASAMTMVDEVKTK